MTETKKAAFDAVNIEDGEVGQLFLSEVGLPDVQSTTNVQRTQGISALLLRGEKNAIPISLLAAWTGWDRRAIRRLIQAERQAGACICADNRSGYYLAETEGERAACVRSMRHRAAEVERTARAIERAEVN